MKVCAEPRCPDLTDGTYCSRHKPKAWASSDRRKRLPKDWEARRKRVLRRDPYCKDGRICLGLSPSTEVDHIQPGDDHSLRALQGICGKCHSAKTQAEARAARTSR